jgi:hypothetical protein
MNNTRRAACLALSTALLSACDARYRDVSSEPAYRIVVGQTCTLVVDLRAHGVTKKIEREKKTDFVTIWNPGFSGPERTFLEILKPGTQLKILAARQCTNCPFEDRLEYEVKVIPEPIQFEGKPAYLRAESMSAQHMQCAKPMA